MDRDGRPMISLTFDDGPNTTITPLVLDILEENEIPASFFLIANNIKPECVPVIRRALSLGCEIENHSVTHGFMDKMPLEQITWEVTECSAKITEITGRAPQFFRPPFIAVNQTMYDLIPLSFICGVGCEDWVPTVSAQQRIDRILADAKDGNLVLLHDMWGNMNTVEAIRVIIPELKKQGWHFMTCSGIFREAGVIPQRNRLYSNVYQTEDRP